MAVKTWIATTASIWSTPASWSGGTTPVSGDSIVFNAAGPGNCTVSGVPGILLISLTSTGYTGQLIFQQVLNITGNVTLSNTHTISSSPGGVLAINGNSTLTTNGCVLDLTLRLDSNPSLSITVLLADNCVVNKGFQGYGTPLGSIIFQSSVPGTQRIFTVSNLVGTTQDIEYLNATDLDSDAGISLWTYSGTISNCRNWAVMTPQPPPVSSISCT